MQTLPNQDVRDYAKEKGVELWRLSEKMGYSYSTALSAYLRKPLTADQKRELLDKIDEIAVELEGGETE